MLKKDGKIDAYCSCCKRKTHHALLHSERVPYPDDDMWGYVEYQTVKCLGCDNISFQLEMCDETDEDYDSYGDTCYTPRYVSYPSGPTKEVKVLEYTMELPPDIDAIYRETIRAFNDGLLRLTATGFRATIEAVCINTKTEGKNLDQKINNLCKSGIITKRDRDRLHSVRFIGNDSVHEIKAPNQQQLELVLEIINSMLNSLYVLDNKCYVLERPVSNFDELEQIIDKVLEDKTTGMVLSFENLINKDRRVISADRRAMETLLQENIKNGSYTKLSICPPPADNKSPQQYKIL